MIAGLLLLLLLFLVQMGTFGAGVWAGRYLAPRPPRRCKHCGEFAPVPTHWRWHECKRAQKRR